MLKAVYKIWIDTTQVNGRYVAKDVKGMIAFFVGLVFLAASAIGVCFGVSISVEIGIVLLSYSLGAQAFKSHYQAKAVEIVANCNDSCDDKVEDEKV
jgi:membrane protein required for beta-lactamase induction